MKSGVFFALAAARWAASGNWHEPVSRPDDRQASRRRSKSTATSARFPTHPKIMPKVLYGRADNDSVAAVSFVWRAAIECQDSHVDVPCSHLQFQSFFISQNEPNDPKFHRREKSPGDRREKAAGGTCSKQSASLRG
jgi:hypothetical protein